MAKLRLDYFDNYRSEQEMPGQIQQIVRLRIKSGAATSGPPIGPVLGQYAIPISKFCTEFNDRTLDFFTAGVEVFVTLFYLVDGSYIFELASPISSICFRRAVGIKKGSSHAGSRRRPHVRAGIITPYMLFEAIIYKND